MALDRVIDSSVLESNLVSVANAIRAKGGTAENLVFPTGFVSAVQVLPNEPQLQSKSASPSLSSQIISPDAGKDGLSSVTISPITNQLLTGLDADFVAENIKKDVDLFGLIGTLAGGSGIVTGSFTPAAATQEVTITHNFGAIPNIGIWCRHAPDAKMARYEAFMAVFWGSNTSVLCAYNGSTTATRMPTSISGVLSNNEDSVTYDNNRPFNNANATTIDLKAYNTNGKFLAGVTYDYVLIA